MLRDFKLTPRCLLVGLTEWISKAYFRICFILSMFTDIFVIALLLFAFSCRTESLKWVKPLNTFGRRNFARCSVPAELEGQLDPSKSWDVTLIFNGVEKVVNVKEDCSILDASEKYFDGVESSCRNGVCSTCAGQVASPPDVVHFL